MRVGFRAALAVLVTIGCAHSPTVHDRPLGAECGHLLAPVASPDQAHEMTTLRALARGEVTARRVAVEVVWISGPMECPCPPGADCAACPDDVLVADPVDRTVTMRLWGAPVVAETPTWIYLEIGDRVPLQQNEQGELLGDLKVVCSEWLD